MKPRQYKIYLDVCSLNRPFDEQIQERIRLESEAVIMILNRCQAREWQLITSNALDAEIAQTSNLEKMKNVRALLSIAQTIILVNETIKQRTLELGRLSFSPYDAAHIASAEEALADVMITTDDRLLKKASRYTGLLRVKISNPIQWMLKVNQ